MLKLVNLHGLFIKSAAKCKVHFSFLQPCKHFLYLSITPYPHHPFLPAYPYCYLLSLFHPFNTLAPYILMYLLAFNRIDSPVWFVIPSKKEACSLLYKMEGFWGDSYEQTRPVVSNEECACGFSKLGYFFYIDKFMLSRVDQSVNSWKSVSLTSPSVQIVLPLKAFYANRWEC